MQGVDRRQFLKLAGLGGVVFASGLARGADGYALVSDVARADLETLATKIAGPEG